MNRFIIGGILFAFSLLSRAQAPLAFTIYTISPTASITCSQPAVNFIAASNYSSALNYYWQGPVASYYGDNVSINVPGTYTVMAFAASVATMTKTITVGINTAPPVSTLTFNTLFLSCSNPYAVTYTATSNIGANAQHNFISPPGATVVIDGSTALYRPATPGVYIHVLVNKQNGCKTTKFFNVVAGAGGFPTFTLTNQGGYSLGCSSTSLIAVTINNASAATPGATLSYTLMGPATSTTLPGGTLSNINTYVINTPGTYTAVARDNSTQCAARVAFSVLQNTIAPNVTIIAPNQTLTCYQPSLQIQAVSPVASTTYSWTRQGSPGYTLTSTLSVSANTANVQNTLVDTYTLIAKGDGNFCFTSYTLPVYQNIFPPKTSINHGNLRSLTCLSPTIVLANQSSTGIPPNSGFQSNLPVTASLWSAPLPQSPGPFTNTYAAYTSGIYTLQAIDLNNGCINKDTVAIFDGKVYPGVNPSGALKFCLNSSVTVVAIHAQINGTETNYTYLWSGPAAASLNPVNTATVIANALGIYSVAVTNTSNGCSTLGQVIVTDCITGISENKENIPRVSAYPNPTSGRFTLNYTGSSKKIYIKIYSPLGILINEQSFDSDEKIFDLSAERNGIYLLVIFENDIPFYTLKLLKN